MTRLSDFVPYNPNAIAAKIEDIADKEIVVLDFRLVDGKFGEYAFVDIMTDNNQMMTIMTGAKTVLCALKNARDAMALPLPAKFVRKNRKWLVE